MAKYEYNLDHIDPKWKEGRDYQLVCGLNIESNLNFLDGDENAAKSNRFVPYRIDPRIPLHQEPGDWGFFLIQGEWKLCQFCGKEWWEESNKIGCGSIIGASLGLAAALRNNPNHQSYAFSFRSFESLSYSGKMGAKSLHENQPELASLTMARTNKQLWRDPKHPELGNHNAANLAKKQRAKGYPHDPSTRVKLT
jgi:hypothetical protein